MARREYQFPSDRLRKARERVGLTQDELAQRCGFGQSQQNKWENGKNTPMVETVVNLAEELGVTSDYLLGLTDDPRAYWQTEGLSPTEWAVVRALRRHDLGQLMRIALDEMEREAQS